MKKIIVFTLAIILAVPILTYAAQVRGYWSDRDGDGYKESYTNPYQRMNPNNTVQDNYSHPGNYNPNTGQITPGNPYRVDPYGSNHRQRSIWD
jgi:hypothetical protein